MTKRNSAIVIVKMMEIRFVRGWVDSVLETIYEVQGIYSYSERLIMPGKLKDKFQDRLLLMKNLDESNWQLILL